MIDAAPIIQHAIDQLQADCDALVKCHAHPDTGVIPPDEPGAREALTHYHACINGLRHLQGIEAVRWTPITERMPDDDTTVLVTLEGQGEPTWLGWWDGLGWCDVCTGEYFTGQVIAWAHTLKGMQR